MHQASEVCGVERSGECSLDQDVRSWRDLREISAPEVCLSLPEIQSFSELLELKNFLAFGKRDPTTSLIEPFAFSVHGVHHRSQAAGLEGFVFTEAKLRELHGVEALVENYQHFEPYLRVLLEVEPIAAPVIEVLNSIKDCDELDPVRYVSYMSTLNKFVELLKDHILAADGARWFHTAETYWLYPRQYDLTGRREQAGVVALTESGKFFRDFAAVDLDLIDQVQAIDTIWVSGIHKRGALGIKGDAGGSPFAISDYLSIEEDLGSQDDYNSWVQLVHKAGKSVIGDFIFNHTSRDAKWLQADPTLYIYRMPEYAEEAPPPGYFEHTHSDGTRFFIAHGGYENAGVLDYFTDTAQLNIFDHRTRQLIIQTAKEMAATFQWDGARIDMGLCLTNEYFARAWFECEWAPETELLAELIAALKEQKPDFVCVVEAYDKWDTFSMSGVDVIYCKNDMHSARYGMHTGYYDALVGVRKGETENIQKLKDALLRIEYLFQDVGSADPWVFDGNHDEPSNVRQFGEHWQGVAVLTGLLGRERLFIAGQEVLNDQAAFEREGDYKPMPFSQPGQINWSNDAEAQNFYSRLAEVSRALTHAYGYEQLEVLPEMFSMPGTWVGYRRYTDQSSNTGVAVIYNPATNVTDYYISGDSVVISGQLQAGGFVVLDLDTGERLFADDFEVEDMREAA